MCIRDRLLYDAQRQGTNKEYEADKKAILYFDDGLAELKGKADEYGKAKVSSPVSYTHLDVYKRQALSPAGAL